MQAVIIAGGKGTRLRPLTYGCPKPMLPLVDRPFLEWMINRCREASVCDILLNVQYQARQVIDYFGDGDRFGVKIRYSCTVARNCSFQSMTRRARSKASQTFTSFGLQETVLLA